MLHRHPRASRLVAFIVAGSAVATAIAGAPAPARAAGDTLASELMRLTNLDRAALGAPALVIDPTLAGYATSAAFSCPTNPSMTIAGRAADMAARTYFAHAIKDCFKADGAEYNSLEIMSGTFGYNTYRAENIAWNNYSTGSSSTYDTGCASGASAGCPGAETTAILSVAAAQRGFMDSPGHRASLLGDYDRFGCGSGQTAAGRVYYACLFSKGGPAPTTVVPASPASPPDKARPRVTGETGRGAAYRRGSTRSFAATLSDDRGVSSGTVLLDGRRVGSWSWAGAPANVRPTVRVSARWLTRGRHVLVWRALDAAGNSSTAADGKVVFTVR